MGSSGSSTGSYNPFCGSPIPCTGVSVPVDVAMSAMGSELTHGKVAAAGLSWGKAAAGDEVTAIATAGDDVR